MPRATRSKILQADKHSKDKKAKEKEVGSSHRSNDPQGPSTPNDPVEVESESDCDSDDDEGEDGWIPGRSRYYENERDIKEYFDDAYALLSKEMQDAANECFPHVAKALASSRYRNKAIYVDTANHKLAKIPNDVEREADLLLAMSEIHTKQYIELAAAVLIAQEDWLVEPLLRTSSDSPFVPLEEFIANCKGPASEFNGRGLYLLVSPAGNFYVGMSDCVAYRIHGHRSSSVLSKRVDSHRNVYPASEWAMYSLVKNTPQTPLTAVHTFEILMIAISGATVHQSGCNTNLLDSQFFRSDKIPGLYLIQILEAITAYVGSGGLLPARSQAPHILQEWANLFSKSVEISIPAVAIMKLACGRLRRSISVPYLEAHPISDEAWSTRIKELNMPPKKRKPSVQPKVTTAEDAESRKERKRSYGIGPKNK